MISLPSPARSGRWLLLAGALGLAACTRPGSSEAPASSAAPTQPAASATLHDVGKPNARGFRDVSPQDVATRRGAARVVDVREPDEFNDRLGHIPGAELVPLAELGGRAGSWDREADVVVVCRSGARSGLAAKELTRMGFRRVMNVEGGMLAYNAAGLPTERKLPAAGAGVGARRTVNRWGRRTRWGY